MRRRKHTRGGEIQPDEILLDAKNLPGLDTARLEGRIERPISRGTFFALSVIFLLPLFVFVFKTGSLTLVHGAELRARSERNTLEVTPLFAERGLIYDRFGERLAWNDQTRIYSTAALGASHIIGYIGLPNTEELSGGKILSTETVGRDGVEKLFDETLRGTRGRKIIEADVYGTVESESVQVDALSGTDLYLSLDGGLERALYDAIESLAKERGFEGGAGAIMDVGTGELYASVSYPGFDNNVLAKAKDTSAISSYLNDKRTPFLNRVLSGLYTPGSIVKPFVAIGALDEGVITPEREILSTGSISVPNPYDQDNPSVFKDWKAHGLVDMRHAIAMSSNVYFYEVGGGYREQKGIGIEGLNKYMLMFGLGIGTGIELRGEEVGNVPSPEWKRKTFDGEAWRIGDTYNTAIGQYGFQVTPLQMVRAIGALATDGMLVKPTIMRLNEGEEKKESREIALRQEHFQVVKEGMRLGAQIGTAQALSTPHVKVAGKTGTAELGAGKELVNSWVMGFFPYEKPRFSFVIVMERGPRANLVGATAAMRNVILWMAENRPEYLEDNEQ